MGVVNTKATAVSNADASPRIPNTSFIEGAPIIESAGTVETTATDAEASTYRFCRVRSGDRLSELLFANDSIDDGGGSAGEVYMDIGLYKTAGDGGAVVDADLFVSAVDVYIARAQLTDLHFESGSTDKSKVEKRIWELLGLDSDPFLEYDICATANNAPGSAGTMSMCARVVR